MYHQFVSNFNLPPEEAGKVSPPATADQSFIKAVDAGGTPAAAAVRSPLIALGPRWAAGRGVRRLPLRKAAALRLPGTPPPLHDFHPTRLLICSMRFALQIVDAPPGHLLSSTFARAPSLLPSAAPRTKDAS